MARIAVLMALVAMTATSCHEVGGPVRRPLPPVAVSRPSPPPPVVRPASPPHGAPVAWQRSGPPPWAPAHGYRQNYRKKQRGTYYDYAAPYGIQYDTCYREEVGQLLGGMAGAAAGYQFGKGDGKTAAVIGGTIIGMLIGGHIGRSMDEVDQNCIGQVLEHAPPNEPVTWQNPQNGGQYEVTPAEPYNDRQGRYCREYQTTATIGGRIEQVYGTACRQPDGSWQIVN